VEGGKGEPAAVRSTGFSRPLVHRLSPAAFRLKAVLRTGARFSLAVVAALLQERRQIIILANILVHQLQGFPENISLFAAFQAPDMDGQDTLSTFL
jgi:hypothetical protein